MSKPSFDIKAIYFVDDSDDEVFISKLAFKQQSLQLEMHHFYDLDSFFDFLEQRTVQELVESLTVLDLNLTLSRGTDGVERIRAQPHLADHIVGICSGSDDPADRLAALSAGAAFFIAKPMNREALEAICSTIDSLHLENRGEQSFLVRDPTLDNSG